MCGPILLSAEAKKAEVQLEKIDSSDRLSVVSTSDGSAALGTLSFSSSSSSGCSGSLAGDSDNVPDVDGHFESDYALEPGVVGVGGTCSVRAAVCQRTGKSVAVKSFIKDEVDPACWQLAANEREVLRCASHPHIVRLENSYVSDEAVHLVLERLEGGELLDRILAANGLEEQMAASIAVQLLRSLGYLHACGIMHRDLKPENVVFTSPDSQHVKVIDFGLAVPWRKQNGAHGQPGMWQQYAAPEFIGHSDYDWRADMWSFGALMYTTMTAQFLYRGKCVEVARKSRLGKIDVCKAFGCLSESAQDFVNSFLVASPAGRPDALQALSHPWLQKHAPAEVAAARAEVALLEQTAPRTALAGTCETHEWEQRQEQSMSSGASCFIGLARWCSRICAPSS